MLTLDGQVLLVLCREGAEGDGQTAMDLGAALEVAAGSARNACQRLMDSGWVRTGRPTSSGKGRLAYTWRITAAGRRALQGLASEITQAARNPGMQVSEKGAR